MMKYNYFLIACLLLLGISTVKAQELELTYGTNFTDYKYSNSQGEPLDLEKGTGTFFGLSYLKQLDAKSRIHLKVGLALNSFNALGSVQTESVSWDTKYAGIIVGGVFKIPTKFIQFRMDADVSIHHLIYGKQTIGSDIYNLSGSENFDKLRVMGGLSIGLEKQLNTVLAVYAGYGFSGTLLSSEEGKSDLQFQNNQVRIGLVIKMNSNKSTK